MLNVADLNGHYGDLHVINNLSLYVEEGEVVALFGPNGHGKSSLLKIISGLNQATNGSIKYRGQEIANLPSHKIVELGIAYIPEERHLFMDMSVIENLNLGAYNKHAQAHKKQNLEFVFDVFPRLAERKSQLCYTMSGGESRMVAVARGLMSEPSLLLVDEPSIGLSPSMRNAVFEALVKINKEKGITLLIVEQEIRDALRMANRVYVIKKGEILFEKNAQDVLISDIEKSYF